MNILHINLFNFREPMGLKIVYEFWHFMELCLKLFHQLNCLQQVYKHQHFITQSTVYIRMDFVIFQCDLPTCSLS